MGGRMRFAIAPLLAALVCGCAAQVNLPDNDYGRLKHQIDALFDPLDVEGAPGASIIVSRGGEIIYERNFGFANLEHEQAIEQNTVFALASVSKQFAAYALYRLAQDGRIDLEADIRTYLPELPEYSDVVRVRHLVYHTSGIRSFLMMLYMSGWELEGAVVTRKHALDVIFRQKGLNFSPGHEYSYNNSGYLLIAEIVSRASGMSYPEWLEQFVFSPLGMQNTHAHDDRTLVVPNLASSYFKRNEEWRLNTLQDEVQGSSGIYSSARDLIVWLNFLDDLQTSEPELWVQLTAAGMFDDGSQIPGELPGQGVAAGLMTDQYNEEFVLWHGGGIAGFRNMVMLAPEHDIAVVVLGNSANDFASAHTYAVMKLALGQTIDTEREDATFATSDFDDKINLLVAEASAGAYSLPRSMAAELTDYWPERSKRSSDMPILLRVVNGSLQISTDMIRWRPIKANTPLRFQINEDVELILADGENPVFSSDRGSISLAPAASPEQCRYDRIIGRYYSDEMHSWIKVSEADSGVFLEYPRSPKVALICVSRELFVLPPAEPNYSGLLGINMIEPVYEDEKIRGIEATTWDRVRQAYFNRQGD